MTSKEQAKERRDWLRKHGICIQCGQQDAVKGFVRCGDCLYKQMQYRDTYKAKHGKVEQAKQVKERKRKLKEQGICIQCGKRKIYKGGLCPECWAKAKTRRTKYYEKTYARERWEKENLCRRCGAAVVPGFKVCQRCLDDIRKAKALSPKNEYWVQQNQLIFMKKEEKKCRNL